jgi:uncharacterized protein YlzI (FlbEa/FlbD family)
MMNAISTFATKMMNTINGKLIVLNSSEFDEVKQKIEQIDRKFELMANRETIDSDPSMNESLQQLNSIGLSVLQLRQIYSRFIWVIVAAGLGLTLVNLLGNRYSSCSARASETPLYRDADSVIIDEDR